MKPERQIFRCFRLIRRVTAGLGFNPARVIVLGSTVLALAFNPAGAAAPASKAAPAYYPVFLKDDGGIARDELQRLSGVIRASAGKPSAQMVLLIHGYNTSQSLGRRQYRQIARDLTAAGKEQGWNPVVIGVHWPSHPGPLLRWLPKMLGYRFISGTGFPNALSNPYLEKSKLAAATGRTGLRALLFRLQDDYPKVPVHVLAHSMGSELVVRALAPKTPQLPLNAAAIEQPGRILKVQMAVLAGADLDQDVFAQREQGGVPAALPRAAVWWITVPRKNSADAALELRRSAGRRDAVGNVGLELAREQLAALIARRGLVIDSRRVPIVHDIREYYTQERLQDLSAAMLYLQQPEAPAAQKSVLADLDAVLRSKGNYAGNPAPDLSASVRLYLGWIQDHHRMEYGPVRVSACNEASPAPALTPARHGLPTHR